MGTVSSHSKRDQKQIIAQARELGFDVVVTAKGHLRCRHTNGSQTVIAPSPDGRSDHVALSRLRRVARSGGARQADRGQSS